MQTAGIPYQKPLNSLSVLKTANEQPKLAGELISKTVESMQSQNAPTPIQPIHASTGMGKIINTTA